MAESARNTSEPYVSAGHGDGDAWAAEAATQGHVGTQRLLHVFTTDPADDVQRELRLHPGEQIVTRSRLILSDGRPVEIATSHYPASFAGSTPLARSAKIKGGAVAVLAGLGLAATDVLEALTARWPTTEEAATLDVDDHEPLLVLTRTSFDQTGAPVEFAVNVSVARRSAPHTYRLKNAAP